MLGKLTISMDEKSKQTEVNTDKDGAVGYSEVFKPKSLVRGVTCTPRKRMVLEYELC